MNVLVSVMLFVCCSLLLEWLQRRLIQTWPALAASPGFYLGLVAVAMTVLLPWPAFQAPLAVPAHLLEAGSWQWQQWTAQTAASAVTAELRPKLDRCVARQLADCCCDQCYSRCWCVSTLSPCTALGGIGNQHEA